MYKRIFGSLFNRGARQARAGAESAVSAPKDPLAAAMLARKSQNKLSQQGTQLPRTGDLAGSSLFGDTTPAPSATEPAALTAAQQAAVTRRARLDPFLSAPALDPRPKARRRWVARQVRRAVRDQGAISKETQLARTERAHLARSHWMQTSLKKLIPLARQIQGKAVDEALVQLRFSKKMVAAEVARHLAAVRDDALLTKGMGLHQQALKEPVEVRDYHGRRRLVTDAAHLYIHRAFVGRGPYGKVPEYRARGRMNVRRPPYTSISFELREEKTRVRITQERQAREDRRGPWVHHPDRPITQQQQYIMW